MSSFKLKGEPDMKKSVLNRSVKYFAFVIALFVCIMAGGIKVSAAPRTMPDGGLFDAQYYAAQNPDVKSIFGTNEALLYQHYLLFGKNEGRLPYSPSTAPAAAPAANSAYTLPDGTEFDPVFYAAAYPDVVAAFGNNPDLLFMHYQICGMAEGRLPRAASAAPAAPAQAVSSQGITEAEAYQRIASLQTVYPEGMRWDYSVGSYLYKGFSNIYYYGYECAGYAFLVNDYVFGDTPNARYIYDGSHSNFHVGDILRYTHRYGEHSVIVWQVTPEGVICTEGNYNSSVHWGRLLRWSEIDAGFQYLITRY